MANSTDDQPLLGDATPSTDLSATKPAADPADAIAAAPPAALVVPVTPLPQPEEKSIAVDPSKLYRIQVQDDGVELKEEQINFAQKYITPVMLGLFTTAAMNSTVAPVLIEKIPALETFAAEVAKYFVKMPQWVGDMLLASNGLNNVRIFRHPKDMNANVNGLGKTITHLAASAIVYCTYRWAMSLDGKSPDPVQIPVPPYMIMDPAINLLNLCVQTAGTSLLQRPLEFTFGPILSQLQRPAAYALGCVAYPFVYCGSKVTCTAKVSLPACFTKVGASVSALAKGVSGAFSYVKSSIFACNSNFKMADKKKDEQNKIMVSVRKVN